MFPTYPKDLILNVIKTIYSCEDDRNWERVFSLYIRDKLFCTKVSNNRKLYIIQGIGIKLDLKLVELKLKYIPLFIDFRTITVAILTLLSLLVKTDSKM